ncbi:hypothetical protein [Luteolibacter sp. AS25]|uniref:hypothetical protein n=1 Tax=Luteolibacter sp. AS25 TaxID=3135776 RepID=UPI00398AF42F
MPTPEDFRSMWWKDGFPTFVKGAAWVKIIHTGHYALAIDTCTMKVTEFGPAEAGTNYDTFVTSGP